MEVVFQKEPHSMSWCLDCHRAPENHLRPMEQVFNLDWQPPKGASQQEIGHETKAGMVRQPAPDL